MANECGNCSLCCKLQGIEEIDKPTNKWCEHTKPGCGGCAIYATKPQSCTDYKCLWLSLGWPAQYKPDVCGVIWEAPNNADDYLILRVKPEDWVSAWRKTNVMHMIGAVLKQGLSVAMTDGRRSTLFKANELKNRWAMYPGEFLGNEAMDGTPIDGPASLDRSIGVKRYRYDKPTHTGTLT